jgi:hypothetical protein
MTALKTSIARSEHHPHRDEFTDCGLATVKDGYTVSQIPNLTRKVWQQSLGEAIVSRPAVFSLWQLHALEAEQSPSYGAARPLSEPGERLKKDGWCFFSAMDQGVAADRHG